VHFIVCGTASRGISNRLAGQGGDAAVVDDTSRLPSAAHTRMIPAPRAGFVTSLDALLVGRAAVALGAGRDQKGDAVDPAAGILLHKKPGDAVQAGDAVLELRYNDAARLDAAVALATQATVVGDLAPAAEPLVLGWVHDQGETMFVAGM